MAFSMSTESVRMSMKRCKTEEGFQSVVDFRHKHERVVKPCKSIRLTSHAVVATPLLENQYGEKFALEIRLHF